MVPLRAALAAAFVATDTAAAACPAGQVCTKVYHDATCAGAAAGVNDYTDGGCEKCPGAGCSFKWACEGGAPVLYAEHDGNCEVPGVKTTFANGVCTVGPFGSAAGQWYVASCPSSPTPCLKCTDPASQECCMTGQMCSDGSTCCNCDAACTCDRSDAYCQCTRCQCPRPPPPCLKCTDPANPECCVTGQMCSDGSTCCDCDAACTCDRSDADCQCTRCLCPSKKPLR